MHLSLNYSLKVWLTAVLVAPVMIMIVESVSFDFYIYAVMLGGVLSLPSVIILCIITYWLLKIRSLTVIYIKLVLTFISVLLTMLPFIWMNNIRIHDLFLDFTTSAYILAIVIGVWVHNLHPKE